LTAAAAAALQAGGLSNIPMESIRRLQIGSMMNLA
jgi:hypothetical protein